MKPLRIAWIKAEKCWKSRDTERRMGYKYNSYFIMTKFIITNIIFQVKNQNKRDLTSTTQFPRILDRKCTHSTDPYWMLFNVTVQIQNMGNKYNVPFKDLSSDNLNNR